MRFILTEEQTKIPVPEDVYTLSKIFTKNNKELVIVGGAVRDALLGKSPKDYDLASNATPDEMVEILEKEDIRVIPTGIQHGTITAHMSDDYEITTYRADKNIGEGHKDVAVTFVDSLEEDLSRRDLTINAMAYDIKNDKIIDMFGGQEDLEKKIIQTVGTADDRFVGEIDGDPLRMLRAVRFAGRLGFEIAPEVIESMKTNADSIETVSKERVKMELDAILMSDKPSTGIKALLKAGILDKVLPGVSRMVEVGQSNINHVWDVFDHTMEALDHSGHNLVSRWSALLHDIGKPDTKTTDEKGVDHFYDHADRSAEIADDVMKDLKFDNKTRQRIGTIVKHHDMEFNAKRRSRFKSKLRTIVPSRKDYETGWEEDEIEGMEKEYKTSVFDDIVNMRHADIKAQNPDLFGPKDKRRQDIHKLYRDIIDTNEPVYVSDLEISGFDIINSIKEVDPEFKGSRAVGDILNELLRLVTDNPEYNNRERLLTFVPKIYGRMK